MGRVIVLGEAARVAGFALGGATVITAENREAVLRAWADLGDEVAIIVLTTQAAAALDGAAAGNGRVLTVVMPP